LLVIIFEASTVMGVPILTMLFDGPPANHHRSDVLLPYPERAVFHSFDHIYQCTPCTSPREDSKAVRAERERCETGCHCSPKIMRRRWVRLRPAIVGVHVHFGRWQSCNDAAQALRQGMLAIGPRAENGWE
jgi:hypothetical protein